MPYYSKIEDPLTKSIDSWDAGVEYIDPQALPQQYAMPYYPPPSGPEPMKSSKTAKYIPDTLPQNTAMRASPEPYDEPRPRHTRHRSPTPDRHHHERRHHRDHHHHDEPPRHREVRDTHHHSSHHERPSITTAKTTPAPTSEAPRRRHHHSSSPPRRSKTARHYNSSDSSRGRHSDPPHHSSKGAGTTKSAPRPGLSRSKTTAAASELFANPRFQKAAAAALQAGGMAALKQRKTPGNWYGQKGASVGIAALGAAAVDAFRAGNAAAKDGGEAKKSPAPPPTLKAPEKGGAVDVGSAIGGLLAQQFSSRGGGSKKGRGKSYH